MTRIIWVTGRAATGKSTVIGHVKARMADVEVHAWCDEDLLFELKTADTSHQYHSHPRDDPDAFVVRSGFLFDEGIRRISAALTSLIRTGPEAIAVVELARGTRRPIDVSYRRALQLIEPSLWPCSVVFRLDADLRTQVNRNRARATPTCRATPTEVLHDLYREDDPRPLLRAGLPVVNLSALAEPEANADHIIRLSGLSTYW